jgi:hypothetical protein
MNSNIPEITRIADFISLDSFNMMVFLNTNLSIKLK